MLVLKCSGLIKYIGMCSKLNSPPKVSPCPNAWNLWIWPYLGRKKKGLCQCNWECWCETILDLMRVLKLTRQTWVWVGSGSWWWTGKLGMLQSTGSQRARHNWVTELNWTETQWELSFQERGRGRLQERKPGKIEVETGIILLQTKEHLEPKPEWTTVGFSYRALRKVALLVTPWFRFVGSRALEKWFDLNHQTYGHLLQQQ